MPICYTGNATSPERISWDNQWLSGNDRTSSGYWICDECALRPVLDIEVFVEWCNGVVCGAIRMSNSPIGDARESTSPAESVDKVVLCAGRFIGFPLIGVGHCLGGESSEAAAFEGLPGILFQGAKDW